MRAAGIDSADYDRWRLGGQHHKRSVLVTCTCWRKWRTVEHFEYGATDYENSNCPDPKCEGEIADVEPDDGYED